jgi:hypothetical protein
MHWEFGKKNRRTDLIMKNVTEQPSLAVAVNEPMPITKPPLTSLEILDTAVRGGVTSENVAVVREIIAMRREEVKEQNKSKFNRAFFELKKEIAQMDFYADKAALNSSKVVAYTYCSEKELASKLDPVLLKHGFTMLFGQRDDAGKTAAIITLIHEDGHEETREYSVRSGNTNAMKDATAADTGATTSAWRHLVIKMFGLKSRIREEDDAKNLGETNVKITKEQADELARRVGDLGDEVKMTAFWQYARATKYSDIPASMYDSLDKMLAKKEGNGR